MLKTWKQSPEPNSFLIRKISSLISSCLHWTKPVPGCTGVITGHTLFVPLTPSLPILLPVPVTILVLIYVTIPDMVRHLLV